MHRKMRQIAVAIGGLMLAAMILAGCSPVTREGAGGRPPASPAASQLTADQMKNATYSGIYDEPVILVDGLYEGEPFVEGGAARPTVGLAPDFRRTGDLDGDGTEEAVVVLWESSGGSGTFNYVAVAGRREGQVVNLGTAELGDRVQVRAARVVDGTNRAVSCRSFASTRTSPCVGVALRPDHAAK